MKTILACAAALALLSTAALASPDNSNGPTNTTTYNEPIAQAGAASASLSSATSISGALSIAGGGDAHSTSNATGGIGIGGQGGDARAYGGQGGDAHSSSTSGPSSAVSGPSSATSTTGPISNVNTTGPSTSSANTGPSTSAANDSSRHDQTTTVDASTHQVRQVATAFAPSVINVASCAIGGSGAIQGSTFGVSFGGAKIDQDCNRRADAAMWLQLGEREAAVARMSGLSNPDAIKLGRSR